MSIISVIALFVSWVVSTFVGIMAGISYLEWVRNKECEAILNAIKEGLEHVE